MPNEKTTPSGQGGVLLTEEIYKSACQILKEEGGNIYVIMEQRFGVRDFNHYAHYYGYNKPID